MTAPQTPSRDAVNFPPIGSTAGFRPRTGTMDEWNEAYVRVENYLRAHRIHNRLHQSRLKLTMQSRRRQTQRLWLPDTMRRKGWKRGLFPATRTLPVNLFRNLHLR